MIPQIKKILYTTDLSTNARHAFGYAASLSDRYGAKITIIHVLEEISSNVADTLVSMLGEERWLELRNRNAQEVRDTIKARIQKFCDDMNAEFDKCSFVIEDIVVRVGTPVEKIIAEAEKIGCDLIVMGTHGQGTLADTMLGSTARRVVRRSSRPVLTIRLPKEK